MSCLYPLQAWKRSWPNKATGKYPITFNAINGTEPLEIPCNKCIGCQMAKRAEWSVRCAHEASQHEQNSFLTLTYADEWLPPHLEQPVLSKFFRKLRDSGNKFRYYACGEYGTLTKRPHYHAIIFGMDWLGGAEQISEDLYFNPILQAAWGKGQCSVGNFTLGAACYVAGYVAKKANTTEDDSFQIMSRRPGIGHGWLDKYHQDILGAECVVIDGTKFPIPRRYLAWKELEFASIKEQRKQYMQSMTTEERRERQRQATHREINYHAKMAKPTGKI